MKLARPALLVLLLGAAGAAAGVAVAHHRPGHQVPPGHMKKHEPRGRIATSFDQLRGVNFVSACRFSHRAGTIRSSSRPAGRVPRPQLRRQRNDQRLLDAGSLLSGATRCLARGDTAAYWMPTLFANGQPIPPSGASIYYVRRSFGLVQPFPPGLKVVAGDSHAMSPQPLRVAFWNCGPPTEPTSAAPVCADGMGSALRLQVRFPSCWDGRNLDSADHKSHMAYSVGGRCPGDAPPGGAWDRRHLPLSDP